MLDKYIQTKIREYFRHTPSFGQAEVIKALSDFVKASAPQEQIFLLKGYAGTGKTSLIAALVKAFAELKQKTVLMAPTGRAAKVLSKYAGKQAFTIHKKIYRQQSSQDGMGKFKLDKNLHTNTLFIIDEASMINNSNYENSSFGSGRMLDDLTEYVYQGAGCKLLLSGDTAQLPPVHSDLSAALDRKELETFGKDVIEYELTDIIRQARESGILYNATELRRMLADVSYGGKPQGFPQIHINGFDDIIRISGRELVETVSDAYGKFSERNVAVICRSNKRANLFNQGIRNTVLYREDEIAPGDLLMVVKNNYFWFKEENHTDFIANGDIAEIKKIYGYEERYQHRFADVLLQFFDYENLEIHAKILLDTLHSESPSLSRDEFKQFYHNVAADYQEIRSKSKIFKKVRENSFFNALQVKYAYAFTCHKAQGGQWKTVFVDQGRLTQNMIDAGFLRWLYTAFTRSEEKLYLVNFSNDFFAGEALEF